MDLSHSVEDSAEPHAYAEFLAAKLIKNYSLWKYIVVFLIMPKWQLFAILYSGVRKGYARCVYDSRESCCQSCDRLYATMAVILP